MNSEHIKIHLAVMQPTSFCNIDCKYCYVPGRSATNRMSLETVKQSFRFLLENPGRLVDPFVVAWHAGEPLAMPLDFYESAFSLLERMAVGAPRTEHWFQTNGTLINQNWCNLIKQWNVKIGISIDGPRWIHDRNRVDRSGRGTFEKVVRGVELLKSNGIDFATIGVLCEQSLDFPEEIWRFYRDLGAKSLAFNFEELEGVHSTSSLRDRSCIPRAQAFFEKLLSLRDKEAPEIFIRELDYFIEGFPQWQQEFRRMENAPAGIIGIAWNGDVSSFSPELIGVKHPLYEDFVCGNVAACNLDDVLRHPRFRVMHRQINSGVAKCKASCDYFRLCGGGQPSNKLYQNGTFDSAETLACKLRVQSVANVVIDSLEKRYGISQQHGESIQGRIEVLLSRIQNTCVASAI